jgi:hypothetical protein
MTQCTLTTKVLLRPHPAWWWCEANFVVHFFPRHVHFFSLSWCPPPPSPFLPALLNPDKLITEDIKKAFPDQKHGTQTTNESEQFTDFCSPGLGHHVSILFSDSCL